MQKSMELLLRTLRHHAKDFPSLKESTIRIWRNLYNTELNKLKCACQEEDDDCEPIELLP